MSNKTNKLNYSLALSTNKPIGTNMDNGNAEMGEKMLLFLLFQYSNPSLI